MNSYRRSLTATESAYVEMVRRLRAESIQAVEAQYQERLAVLLRQYGVPAGARVTIEPETPTLPAQLVVDFDSEVGVASSGDGA